MGETQGTSKGGKNVKDMSGAELRDHARTEGVDLSDLNEAEIAQGTHDTEIRRRVTERSKQRQGGEQDQSR